MCRLSELFHSGVPPKTLCAPLESTVRATCPDYLIYLDFITRINRLAVHIIKLLIM